MERFQTPYSDLNLWSHTDLAYIQQDPALVPFMAFTPGMDIIPEVIHSRKNIPVNRTLLLNAWKKQYERLNLKFPIEDKVLLDDDTFTVITSHQPTLFTGPLYHIYKIASTIHVCRSLKQHFPNQTFLPVFVLGAEDHDWPEVNHLYLYGKRYEWERSSSGPCGRLSLEGLDELISSIETILQNTPHGQEIVSLLREAVSKTNNYGEFHQYLLYKLFGEEGLLILNMDEPELKRAFIPLMEKEIREQFSIQYVQETQHSLEKLGFKPQAFCRPVNLFYMSPGKRERIDLQGDRFVLIESGKQYSCEELISELHKHPENFSPNVILRPLYQEFTLPNIAFIGGGGEIAYWLERKSQFENAGVHFPMLIRRNSLLLIDKSTASQLDKTGLTYKDLFMEYDKAVRKFLQQHSHSELTYNEELALIKEAYEKLATKADKIDPTLSKAILAEEAKQTKQFEQLGSRLTRAEKHQHETQLNRIQKLKEKLFPEGGLQERHDNFLPFYAESGKNWIKEIIDVCDPMPGMFTVILL